MCTAGRSQTDRSYKKPDTITDIRTPIFVSDNHNRIIEIVIRSDIKNHNFFFKRIRNGKNYQIILINGQSSI